MPTLTDLPTLAERRELVESALAFAGGTHTFEDVVEAVEKGEAQFWPGVNSCMVTTLDAQPQRTILLFWLAAGEGTELAAMEPLILQWGRDAGATLARLVGRKGWARSFLRGLGWRDTQYVILEKSL